MKIKFWFSPEVARRRGEFHTSVDAGDGPLAFAIEEDGVVTVQSATMDFQQSGCVAVTADHIKGSAWGLDCPSPSNLILDRDELIEWLKLGRKTLIMAELVEQAQKIATKV